MHPREMIGDPACHDRRVLPDAVEQRGLTLAEEVRADEEQTGRRAAGTVDLPGEPLIVERQGRHREPPPVTERDHVPAEIQVPGVAPGDALRQIVREAHPGPIHRDEVARERDTLVPERPQMEVEAAVDAARGDVRGQTRDRRWELRRRLSEEPRLDRPPHDVLVPDPSRAPRGLAARHDHVAAGADQALGDLGAGLPAPDDQHPSVGQGSRVPVGARVEHREVQRESIGARWHVGRLVRAGADGDRPGPQRSVGGLQDEPVASGLQGRDIHASADLGITA